MEKIRDLRDAQGQTGTWDTDPYMQGLYNGLELALATAEGRDPVFRSKPEGGWKGWALSACPSTASTSAPAEPTHPLMVMTGYQLRAAAEFVNPDPGDTDQLESEVCIQWGPERDDGEGGKEPAGLRVWLADYPEEGSMALDPDKPWPPQGAPDAAHVGEPAARVIEIDYESRKVLVRFAEAIPEWLEIGPIALATPTGVAADESTSPEPQGMRAAFMAWVEDQGCDTDGAWSAWQGCWDLLSAQAADESTRAPDGPTDLEQTLAGLVKRLARRLHPEDNLRVTATEYLQREGFFNPLRASGERTSAPAPEGSVRALASSPAAEPPLPEPSVHSPSEEEPLFTADQMRDYCRECRGTAAGGLSFTIEQRGETRVLVWPGNGCRPATVEECELWDALAASSHQAAPSGSGEVDGSDTSTGGE